MDLIELAEMLTKYSNLFYNLQDFEDAEYADKKIRDLIDFLEKQLDK